jgi:hypothetical protein
MPSRHQAFSSHFYMDGEIAFSEGEAIDRNPYHGADEAFEAWRAGWLDASRMAHAARAMAPFPLNGGPIAASDPHPA